MKIALLSSEAVPFAKTGGLADVAGSLPKALTELGCEVKLFLPKYSYIDEASSGCDTIGVLAKCSYELTDTCVLFIFIKLL